VNLGYRLPNGRTVINLAPANFHRVKSRRWGPETAAFPPPPG
jgi:hypothetical protein